MNNTVLQMLKDNGFTLVLMVNNKYLTSFERGVAPLIGFIEQGLDCVNCTVADRVVGKAAALLYAYMQVGKIYTLVISEPALMVLKSFNICVEYEKLVPFIINRKGDGVCPMENAVANTLDPKIALNQIKSKLNELKGVR